MAALLVLLAAPAGSQPVPIDERLRRVVVEIERNLQEAILDFWFPRSVDRQFGGYLVGFDEQGRPEGDGTKMLVGQARMLWLASRLQREGRGGAAVAEAARQGYAFLVAHLRDREHGGYYWEVDRTGKQVLQPHKHLYGQAFALYALSEYYLASREPSALEAAEQLFRLLEAKAHDDEHGGYREFFARDWSAPPAGVRPYLGLDADLKLMNTHLHLMEAFTAFVRAGALPLARQRLFELITIQSNAVIRKRAGAGTDQHRRDWTPILTSEAARASYGHDLENIWLLVDALEALGLSPGPVEDLFRELFAYAICFGYDEAQGGFYDSGPLGQPADRRDKIWWVQAEALVSALTMHRLTGEERYAEVFLDTWRFTNDRQTDWTNGEWHATVSPDGTGHGDKGHGWKVAYHNGRALLECLAAIRGMGRR